MLTGKGLSIDSRYMKIVAIGGGEIERRGHLIETEKIDREILRLTGKKRPKLLFMPTASGDSEGYVRVVQDYFAVRLGCVVDTLYLINENPSASELEKKIMSVDIIYVGGGNTLKMMTVWRNKGVDRILKTAAQKGIVLAGVSAGSVCWFAYGCSDSRRMRNPKADYIKVRGLGLIPVLHCPHYHQEKDRIPQLKKIMRKTRGVAIALDDCAALEIVDDGYRIIVSNAKARAYKVYWKGDRFFEQPIAAIEKFQPIRDIITK